MKKQYTSISPLFIGKVLLVVLILLVVGGISLSIFMTTHARPVSHTASSSSQNQDAISFDKIEETPAPGAVKVDVKLADFSVASTVTTFRVGVHYYFVVANSGPSVHEFMIMPVKPDGSRLPPDVEYNDKLIEIEEIAPGSTLAINFTFLPSKAGRYQIACLMRGHYEAGMKLPIVVTK